MMNETTDKYVSGESFLNTITEYLIKAQIEPVRYNKSLGKEVSPSKNVEYRTPRISQLPDVCSLIHMTPCDVLHSLGRTDYLTQEDRELLEMLNQFDAAALLWLKEFMMIAIGEWATEGPYYNPSFRVLQIVKHHIIPKSADDMFLFNLKLKYRPLGKGEVSKEDIPKWILCNAWRLPDSSFNFDIEEILDTAKYLKVSFRWLYNYDISASFYGYKPDAETIYDLYTLAAPPMRQTLSTIIKNKLEEVSTNA